MRKLFLTILLVALCTTTCCADQKDDWVAQLQAGADTLRETLSSIDSHYLNIGNMCIYLPDDWVLLEMSEKDAGTIGYFSNGNDVMAICHQDFSDHADLMDELWAELKSFWYDSFVETDNAVFIESEEEALNNLELHQDLFYYDSEGTTMYCISISVKCYGSLCHFVVITPDENCEIAETFFNIVLNTVYL